MKNIAMNLAKQAHHGQMYGKWDYAHHLTEVTNMVIHLYGENDVLESIAWLHDVLEDTYITPKDLLNSGFTPFLIEAVVSVTKTSGESYYNYLKRVRNNPLGLKVKLADTLCNLIQSTKELSVNRINKYTRQLQLLTGHELDWENSYE